MKRSDNKQLALNIVFNVVYYLLELGTSFLLTPYIVKNIGAEAFGFVGLTSNIISYTTLITVALNAMSSRFISIEYNRGNIDKANTYFSSVFYGNLFLSTGIIIVASIFVIYLEEIVNIPVHLIRDVKWLFLLMCFNSILNIIFGVFNVSTFVKNRLELRSVRGVIATALKAFFLLSLFSFFIPKLWFLGISAILCSLYNICYNVHYTKSLTPELKIRFSYFEKSSVWLLMGAGVWSLLTVMSNIFAKGFDLLLSNLFIGSAAMGLLALSISIPTILQSICTSVAITFAPSWTIYYASHDFAKLKNEMLKSVRIMGFLGLIPLSLLFSYGDAFYSLWLPNQDYISIYHLTIVGCVGYIFSFPLDTVWEIFTVTNRVKEAATSLIVNNFMVFALVLIGMFLVDSDMDKLFILAGTRSCLLALLSLIFLPLRGAYLVKMNPITLYKPIFKNLLSVVIICIFSIYLKQLLFNSTWIGLILCMLISLGFSIIISLFITLNRSDRLYFLQIINNKLKK